MNDEKAFLLELEKLSRKYKLVIAGCGCCGSPAIEKLTDNELVDGAGYGYHPQSDVYWLSPEDGSEWAIYKDKVYKEN